MCERKYILRSCFIDKHNGTVNVIGGFFLEEAVTELEEANAIDPHEVSVYFTLGQLYKLLGRVI